MKTDEYWMQQALELARHAAAIGEVPVGAILVADECVIGQGFNQAISHHDGTAHAEIVALRAASQQQQNYRLAQNTTLYVTLEPCCMCVGAMIHARVTRLVFATKEPRAGAVVSQLSLLDQDFFNHRVAYDYGVLAEGSAELLRAFFRERR